MEVKRLGSVGGQSCGPILGEKVAAEDGDWRRCWPLHHGIERKLKTLFF